MRIFRLAAIGGLALGLVFAGSVSMAAQSEAPDGENAALANAAVAPTTGTLALTFNIKLSSSYPAGSIVSCLGIVEGVTQNTMTGAGNRWTELATSSSKVTGSTATCTISIPYSWSLQPTGTGVQNIYLGAYDISVADISGKTVLANRTSTSFFAHFTPIPVTGTTTKFTLNVTL